ncbi:hypothetical protein [Rhodococcus rhodnii]|uniref:hypothetical protein n=1 Tax=Rhodococcus rhodnii TaxID=38312 RepID=UPI0009346661|nr:hypothetical protein [Rhodococcus rhodnii]
MDRESWLPRLDPEIGEESDTEVPLQGDSPASDDAVDPPQAGADGEAAAANAEDASRPSLSVITESDHHGDGPAWASEWLATHADAVPDATAASVPEADAAPDRADPGVDRRRGRAALGVALGAAVVVIVGGGVAAGTLLGSSSTRAEPMAVPGTTTPAASATSPSTADEVGAADGEGESSWCKPVELDDRVEGNGPGGTDSGPAAILAFDHGFYVERSGQAARRSVASDAAVSPAEVLQEGIDGIPEGTEHCLSIRLVAPDVWDVDVHEKRPDGSIEYYPQTFRTDTRDGRTLVTSITKRF